MSNIPPSDKLPDNLASAHAMICSLKAELERQQWFIKKLQHELSVLKRARYGKKSEKVSLSDDQQLALDIKIAELEEQIAEVLTSPEVEPSKGKPGKKRHGGGGRNPFPKTLPVERVEVPAESTVCEKCNEPLVQFGEEVTREVVYVPASLVIKEYARPKLKCPACEDKIYTAPAPQRLFDKSYASPSLVTGIVTGKYCDHIPLFRQEAIFERNGVIIPRSTMCRWIKDACDRYFIPITEEVLKDIMSGQLVNTDDTPHPVMDDKKCRRGYMWVYIGGSDPKWKNVFYEFTLSRSHEGPEQKFKDYKGYIQADAFPGYDCLFEDEDRIEVACWAHARRKFFDTKDLYPEHAESIIGLIRKLYDVEEKARGLSPAAVQSLRLRESRPVLKDIHKFLGAWEQELLPQDEFGKAVRYSLKNWKALYRYTEDGTLSIDNNIAERQIKPVVLGRKNHLFFGSEEGGQRAAAIYSLINTCKLNQINPYEYLQDVLLKFQSGFSIDRCAELTPMNWVKARKN